MTNLIHERRTDDRIFREAESAARVKAARERIADGSYRSGHLSIGMDRMIAAAAAEIRGEVRRHCLDTESIAAAMDEGHEDAERWDQCD